MFQNLITRSNANCFFEGNKYAFDKLGTFEVQLEFPGRGTAQMLSNSSSTNDKSHFVWLVKNLQHLSLGYSNSESIYIRESTRNLVEAIRDTSINFFNRYQLNHNKPTCIDIHGGAGIGKTITLWGVYCLYKGNKIWITASETLGANYIVILGRTDGSYYKCRYNVTICEVYELLESIKVGQEDPLLPIVVFDGSFVSLSYTSFNPINRWASIIQQKKLFVIRSSSGNAISYSDKSISFVIVNHHYMPSFSLADFLQANIALNKETFDERTTKQWFYVVGGNARMFYKSKISIAEELLCTSISAIGNMNEFINDSSSEAAHILKMYQCYACSPNCAPELVVVSWFVYEKVLEKPCIISLNTVKKLAPAIPGYEDVLVAAEMHAKARFSYLYDTIFRLIDREGKEWTCKISRNVEFDNVSELQVYGYSNQPTWSYYKPNAFQNPDYNAMLVFTHENFIKVYILQCTTGKSHSKNLFSIGQFLNAITDINSGNRRQRDWSQQKQQQNCYNIDSSRETDNPEINDMDVEDPAGYGEPIRRGLYTMAQLAAATSITTCKKSNLHLGCTVEVHYVIVTKAENFPRFNMNANPPTNINAVGVHDPCFNFPSNFHTRTIEY